MSALNLQNATAIFVRFALSLSVPSSILRMFFRMDILTYWLWPNPPHVLYANPKVIALLTMSALLVVASLVLRLWRNRLKASPLKTISSHWSGSIMTFGIVALVLVVSRAESIQFLAMRALWLVWVGSLAAYIAVQYVVFRRRYYVVVDRLRTEDAREKYLPKKKKR